MAKYIQICGSPKAPIAVLDISGNIHSLATVDQASIWNTLTPAAPNNATRLCGKGNAIMALGTNVQYLSGLGIREAKWKDLSPALPTGVAMAEVAGDTPTALLLLASDRSSLYKADADTARWKTFSAPFDQVAFIAGDLQNGVLAVSAKEPWKAALCRPDCTSALLSPAPINIEQAAVDSGGIVVYARGNSTAWV